MRSAGKPPRPKQSEERAQVHSRKLIESVEEVHMPIYVAVEDVIEIERTVEVEVPVDRIVEVIKEVEVIREVIKEVEVEKIVERVVYVEKIVEV